MDIMQHKKPAAEADHATPAPTSRQGREELLRALKVALLTSELSVEEQKRGFDPYNTQPVRKSPEVWQAARRRR
jgi:hypothetical protein